MRAWREHVVRRLRTFKEDAYNFVVNRFPVSFWKVWKIETEEFRSTMLLRYVFLQLPSSEGCMAQAAKRRMHYRRRNIRWQRIRRNHASSNFTKLPCAMGSRPLASTISPKRSWRWPR